MSAHRFVCSIHLLVLAICLVRGAPLRAQGNQDLGSPEIENSKFQFTGVVNSNAVYVRSGPSENDYPTLKLDKGAEVVAVGHRFDWLKVTPPEGSFCYVAKAYVDRRGNGSVGRVTSTLNVRVGSQLNELKAKIATKLEPGADVEILGEEQEYFKIKPPAGVYYYINKQFVDPIRRADVAATDNQQGNTAPPPSGAQEQPGLSQEQPARPQEPTAVAPPTLSDPVPPVADSTSTPPGASESPLAPVDTPAREERTTPAAQPVSDLTDEFDRLEARYSDASLKPLDEQPVAELLDGYQKLAASDKLPESMRRIADYKVEVLKSRLEAQQQFADTRKHLDEMKQKQMALKAEREELEQRVKDADFRFYTAVGTLRPSSLQQGTETLYRLTDPANGRTTVYLRTNDTKVASMIGQFIGVKGEVQNDAQANLRVISATEWEPVDAAKVGQTIAAQIVPPSLLPGGGTARTE